MTPLFVDVTFDRFRRDIARRADIVGTGPKTGQSAVQMRELATKFVRRVAFDPVYNLARGQRRRERTEQVNVIRLNDQVDDLSAKFSGFRTNQRVKSGWYTADQNGAAKFRYPDKMIIDIVGAMSCSFMMHKRILANMFYRRKHKETTRSVAHIPLPAQAGSTL